MSCARTIEPWAVSFAKLMIAAMYSLCRASAEPTVLKEWFAEGHEIAGLGGLALDRAMAKRKVLSSSCRY